jgi:hypothetical protein
MSRRRTGATGRAQGGIRKDRKGMFEMKVVGAEEAAVLIGEGWPTRIVTLRAMSGDVVGAHHLYVVVDDVTTVTDKRHPTATHLQQVLDFTRT